MTDEKKVDEADTKEKIKEEQSDDLSDIDWDSVYADAEKNLKRSQTSQVSTDIEEYEREFLALPVMSHEVEPANIQLEQKPDLPSTSHISNNSSKAKVSRLSLQLESFAKKRVDEPPPQQLIKLESNVAVNPPDISFDVSPETQEAIKIRIQKNREEALRRLKMNNIPIPPQAAQSSSTNNQNDPPKVTENQATTSSKVVYRTETKEEIQQRIEKNRQEALKRLEKNGLIPSAIKENLLADLKAQPASSSKMTETLQVHKEQNVAPEDPAKQAAGSSSKALSEEDKRKIEEKRLEAMKRREIWLKNQKKGTN